MKVYLHLLPLSLFFVANLILFLSAIILYIKSKNNSTVNISERKKTEEAFLDSERKLRKIVETSNEGICFVNSDGSLIFVNEKLAEIIGRDAQEILGKSLFDFMDKESMEKAKEKFKDRKNDVKEIFDSKFIKKNGEEVWTIVSATPYFDDNKKNYGSIAIVSNITPIKLFELQLKEKEAL
ncbi:MAG TPA: PAS domain S-box protein, partial [Spirochaetota bacterium]|nr:PAS domain S-box protein [Spirochaetota bacterium]